MILSIGAYAMMWGWKYAVGFVLLISFAGTLPEMLFALFMVYGLSGYAMWIYDKARRQPPTPPPAA